MALYLSPLHYSYCLIDKKTERVIDTTTTAAVAATTTTTTTAVNLPMMSCQIVTSSKCLCLCVSKQSFCKARERMKEREKKDLL